MFKLLFTSAVSACFEIENDTAYYSSNAYDVSLNGLKVIKGKLENVFSLYDLIPDTEYVVSVDDYKISFKTDSVTEVVSVKDFGAIGDGVINDTDAIQNAIDKCVDGGMVVFPKGEYLVLPLKLRSNITLNLEDGAHVFGSTNPKEYPVLEGSKIDENGNEKVISSWEGEIMRSYASILSGWDVENVKVVGKGIIDGNAQNGPWWQKEYVYTREIARPRVVFLNNCKNVRFHGVTVQNGATWNVHPFFSENLGFYDFKVKAPKNAPNTDGLNPEACNSVEIIGCNLSCGDDCIAIKAGTRSLAEKFKRSAKNHLIRNCQMKDGHGAIVIGSEMSGGVENLTVNRCVFNGTDRGLRIKTRRRRGKLAIVDGVEFSNIKMCGVLTPFVVNMFYACGYEGRNEYVTSRKPYPVDDSTPYMGSFLFKDINCVDCEVCAGYFDGLPEKPIEKVVIENVSVAFKSQARADQPGLAIDTPVMSRAGFYFDGVNKVELKNVRVINALGDAIAKKNCGQIKVTE